MHWSLQVFCRFQVIGFKRKTLFVYDESNPWLFIWYICLLIIWSSFLFPVAMVSERPLAGSAEVGISDHPRLPSDGTFSVRSHWILPHCHSHSNSHMQTGYILQVSDITSIKQKLYPDSVSFHPFGLVNFTTMNFFRISSLWHKWTSPCYRSMLYFNITAGDTGYSPQIR